MTTRVFDYIHWRSAAPPTDAPRGDGAGDALNDAPGPLDGHLDPAASPCRLEGWARDPAHPQTRVLLEVVLGMRVLGTARACRHRRDLAEAGLGNAAFVFEAGIALSAEDMADIQLRRVGDGAVLRRSAATRERPHRAEVPAA